MNLPRVDQVEVSDKRVLVRADIDVPIKDGKVADETRLIAIWPTVEFLLSKRAKVVVMGHLGRPGGKRVEELSSKPVAEWIASKIGGRIKEEAGVTPGYRINEKLVVLENLRFDLREEANDESFSKELASLGEVYVNDAFGVSERAHASLVGVPKLLPHAAGFRLMEEVETIERITSEPKRPLVVVIGGAKLETKIPVISKMAKLADTVVVGGKLLTQVMMGSPLMAEEKVKLLRLTGDLKDTTLESIAKVEPILAAADEIIWNGPLGMVEDYTYQVGTRRMAEFIAGTKAYKMVGGGDTVGFVNRLGLTSKFDFISTGGGAMLTLLAGEKLPGVEALLL